MPPARRSRGHLLWSTARLRQAIPAVLALYFVGGNIYSAVRLSFLELREEIVRPSQPPGPAAPATARLLAATASTATAAAATASGPTWRFPEAHSQWFDLHIEATVECTGPLGPAAPYPGPQAAFQACLGDPWCTCLHWDATSGQAWQGSSHRSAALAGTKGSPNEVVALRRGCSMQLLQPPAGAVPQPPCAAQHAAALAAAAASKAARGGEVYSQSHNSSALCPQGLHPVTSTQGGVACSICPQGYCGVLPGALLLPPAALDTPLQAALAASPISADSLHRGFNPSVLEWGGRRVLAVRAANISASCSRRPTAGSLAGGEAEGARKGASTGADDNALGSTGGGSAGAATEKAAEAAEATEAAEAAEAALTVSNHLVLCDLGAAAEPVEVSTAENCRWVLR